MKLHKTTFDGKVVHAAAIEVEVEGNREQRFYGVLIISREASDLFLDWANGKIVIEENGQPHLFDDSESASKAAISAAYEYIHRDDDDDEP